MNTVAIPSPVPAPSAAPLTGLPSAGKLFKDALTFYRAHLRIMLGIALVPAAFTAIAELAGGTTPDALLFLIGIMSVLAAIAARIALIGAVAEDGTPGGGIAGAYQKAAHLFIPFIWLSALGGIATIGGFYLLFVPGLLLSFWLSFSAYALVIDGQRGIAALIASWRYVRGYWWPVFWRFLFFGIFVVIAMLLISVVMSPFEPPREAGLHWDTSPQGFAQSMVASFVMLPLSAIYAFFLWRALKRVKTTAIPPAEEAASIRKRLTIFITIGIVGTALIIAALGTLFAKYRPEIQNFLQKIEAGSGAPAFPQTPLSTAAGLASLFQSLFGGR